MEVSNQYFQDGYTIFRKIVPETMLNRVWMNLHLLVVKQLERLRVDICADMKKNLVTLLERDPDVYISTLSLASRLQSVFDLLAGEDMGAVYAFPSLPVLHVMANDLKVPGGYWGTEAHQDWASTQGSLRTFTLWAPITGAVLGNFPLEVIPGSHKRGLIPGKSNGNVTVLDCKDDEFVPLNLEFGDMLMMSSFLVHRTGKGGSGIRVAASLRYEDVNENSFIERGYPCAQKRSVDRDIKWHPDEEQVRKLYVME